MEIIVTEDYASLSLEAAGIVMDVVDKKPGCVVTLPSGGTPFGMYEALARAYREGRVDFAQVTLFDLDTYAFLDDQDPRSNYSYLQKHFAGKVNISKDRWHRLDGAGRDASVRAREYEEEIKTAGGLDLAVIGIGHNGHIAYNEPGSSFDSRTRLVELAQSTKSANARFVSTADQVPTHGLTMGIGTIMEARRVVLLASGEGKASIIATTLEGPVTRDVPATALKSHKEVSVICDRAAASKLSKARLESGVKRVNGK